jgi:hypothetical protein
MSRQRLGSETVEDPRPDPLVAPGSQRRVRDYAVDEALGVDPGAAGRQPDQDRFEAHPVGHSPSMTSQRVIIDGRGRKQCRHRIPDSIDHLWIQRAHDAGCLHSVVVG